METERLHMFFDLDGTVLVKGEVQPEDLRAMQEAQRAGHRLILCTGRSEGNYETNFGNDFPVRWDAKLFGMSDIVVNGKVLLRREIAVAEVQKWCAYSMEHRFMIAVEGNRDADARYDFSKHPEPFSRRERLEMRARIRREAKRNPPTKMTIYGKYDPSDHPKTKLDPVVHTQHFELVPHGKDKGTVIEEYCELTGTPIENCICFGDSMNDLGMFRVCRTSVCMKKSPEEIIEAATYHATTDTGVAEGIAWLLEKSWKSTKTS